MLALMLCRGSEKAPVLKWGFSSPSYSNFDSMSCTSMPRGGGEGRMVCRAETTRACGDCREVCSGQCGGQRMMEG